MAGQTKLLKENQMLFKLGEPADSMYIIRKGSLKVFLQKGNDEIPLATLQEGAIVGEMAFFDDKPRSACVRSLTPCELTVITKADFNKLLTQVPKWMVSMLQSLSGRLRTTNEKLQKLEQAQLLSMTPTEGSQILPNQRHPYQIALRLIKVMLLSLSRDGQKEGRETLLEEVKPKELINELFQEEIVHYDRVIAVLIQLKFIEKKLDATKVPVLSFLNKGTFVNFIEFFSHFAPQLPPNKPTLSIESLALFGALVEAATASGFEVHKLVVKEVIAAYTEKGTDTKGWMEAMGQLNLIPDLKISQEADISVVVTVKLHKMLYAYLRYIYAFCNAKLA